MNKAQFNSAARYIPSLTHAQSSCRMQVVPDDIDYKVMVTFSEFYQTLLQFVNFKLYHIIGASYPPIVNPRLEEAAAGLSALMQDLADPSALTAPANGTLTGRLLPFVSSILCTKELQTLRNNNVFLLK